MSGVTVVSRTVSLGVAIGLLAGCADLQLTGPGEGSPGIARVRVSPDRQLLVIGSAVQLTAQAWRRECDIEFCREYPVSATFTWRSTNALVAVVSRGTVRALGRGVTYVVAEAGGVRDSARIRVGTGYVPLATITPGGRCALTAAAAAYCWGLAFNSPDENFGWMAPRLVAGGLSFTDVSGGSTLACGLDAAGRGYCWGKAYSLGGAPPDPAGNPVPVAGSLSFLSISAGSRMSEALPPFSFSPAPDPNTHACAVAAGGAAYCWGVNDLGQLGTDASVVSCSMGTCSPTPVPVTGGHVFAAIRAGGTHTCALTADGLAYCWGDNAWGQLGDSAGRFRTAPAAVENVPPLIALTAGVDHTCGLAGDGTALCWGRNDEGQLGIGSRDTLRHWTATPVAGNLPFTSIDAGRGTCATTAAGQVFCWGRDNTGPAPVVDGPPFGSLGVDPLGWAFAVGTDGRAYTFVSGFGTARPVGGPIEF